ncbi:MAG: hypothetical protein ABSG25_11690 [Bryobacteraceae bacterium]
MTKIIEGDKVLIPLAYTEKEEDFESMLLSNFEITPIYKLCTIDKIFFSSMKIQVKEHFGTYEIKKCKFLSDIKLRILNER